MLITCKKSQGLYTFHAGTCMIFFLKVYLTVYLYIKFGQGYESFHGNLIAQTIDNITASTKNTSETT